MSSFPLLRVPFLPLKSIVNNMCIIELIRLRMCSKKLRGLLKATNKSVSFDSITENQRKKLNILEILDLLHLETYNNPRGSTGCFPKNCVTISIIVGGSDGIKIILDRDQRISNKYQACFPFTSYVDHIDNAVNGTRGSIDIDGITVPVVLKDKKTYWNDQSDGLKNLVNYSKKLFNTQIIKCFIYGSNDSNFSQNVRALATGMAQQTISTCIMQTDIPSIHDYTLILNNVKPTNCFEHYYGSKLNSNFQHDVKFTTKCLKLVPGNWFTFDNLCSADCEEILLKGSELESFDMFKYVKLWMSGKFPKLKRLDVELQKAVSLEYFLSELQSYAMECGFTAVKVIDVINIKRQDQTVATISNKEKPCDGRIRSTLFQFRTFENSNTR